ncbi:MAG TPA: DNA repair protein RecO [Longimicrobiales bacterium]|nr:DNA repair protein RecO [Longimicrobiales bacterium]
MAPTSTPAVLLRGYDYGDSSRILRFYTRAHGLVSVVAKGVRGRMGKGAGGLASFASGELTAYVKSHRDLHTMKDFNCLRMREGLGRDMLRFAGASAVAELVLAHTEQESHEGLYQALEAALDRLEHVDSVDLPAAVLAGLWTVTEALGFAPQVAACVRCGATLGEADVGRFDLAAGGVRCPGCAEGAAGPRIGPVARRQVAALLEGELPAALTHCRQHLGLVADFVAYHVAAGPLKSFRFLGSLLPEDPVPAGS